MAGASKTYILPFNVPHFWNKTISGVDTYKVDEIRKKTNSKYCNVLFYHYSIQQCLSTFSTFQISHLRNQVFELDMCS